MSKTVSSSKNNDFIDKAMLMKEAHQSSDQRSRQPKKKKTKGRVVSPFLGGADN
jgi:hypothetical protein